MVLADWQRDRANFNGLRVAAMVFATVLGLGGAWLAAVAAIRPDVPFFPGNATGAEAAAADRGAAGTAAAIGMLRGDLWADYAITLAPQIAATITPREAPAATLDAARAAALRAAALAPHDSRVWLLLAAIDSRLGRRAHNPLGPLKMSYYTGPNETALTPLRILIATRSDAVADPDLQLLIGGELRTIVRQNPALRPLVIAAYRNARPDGKHFIETTVGDLDPDLLAALHSPSEAR